MGALVLNLSSDEAWEDDVIYRQFVDASQEHLRLSAAIKGFFLKDHITQTHRDVYGAYLKRRIRPVMELLIEQEDTDKMAQIAAMDWLNERLTDEFLQTAQMQRKPAALVWLLQMKGETYGFHDKDFSL